MKTLIPAVSETTKRRAQSFNLAKDLGSLLHEFDVERIDYFTLCQSLHSRVEAEMGKVHPNPKFRT